MLTNAYPYHPGEQFIEDEIEYWTKNKDAQVTVLPAVATGTPRSVPNGISIELEMARSTALGRWWFMLTALFSAMFRNELGYLRRSRKIGVYTVLRALLHTSKVIEQAKSLERYVWIHGPIDVAYCYWNETQSYAAVLAKRKGLVRKVVSRVHGIDLYETRRAYAYMPLKRQFIHAYDRIFALSEEAKSYLAETYGASASNVKVGPLGVPLPDILSAPSADGVLHIVSVSFCLPVKRLDRIVEALCLFAGQHNQIKTTWTHIGGGPLLEKIRQLAETKMTGIDNISFEFMGELPNSTIKKYYLGTPVDLFINTSESEGIPVSIMEAMSAGVPAIAPDVGGISNLVSSRCGVLLSKSPSSQEIADAIDKLALHTQREVMRMNARKVIEDSFSSARNYSRFVADVLAIGSVQEEVERSYYDQRVQRAGPPHKGGNYDAY
ncbi:glycosyl transferase family 1 [Dyella lipolytica]|nr:glycosyl transferase family 1 [Dyella lipolytica]